MRNAIGVKGPVMRTRRKGESHGRVTRQRRGRRNGNGDGSGEIGTNERREVSTEGSGAERLRCHAGGRQKTRANRRGGSDGRGEWGGRAEGAFAPYVSSIPLVILDIYQSPVAIIISKESLDRWSISIQLSQ